MGQIQPPAGCGLGVGRLGVCRFCRFFFWEADGCVLWGGGIFDGFQSPKVVKHEIKYIEKLVEAGFEQKLINNCESMCVFLCTFVSLCDTLGAKSHVFFLYFFPMEVSENGKVGLHI